MSYETAIKFIDYILKGDSDYLNFENSGGFVLDFIGGEPLLEVDLICDVSKYLIEKMIRENHPWLHKFRILVGSNGTLYFNEKFQKLLETYGNWIVYDVTIDGNKELHDSCRVFPDGSGSYDLAVAAMRDYSHGFKDRLSSKITLAPENLPLMNEALRHFISLGFTDINANCVFEDVWSIKDAKIFYQQLKEFADYVLDNDLDEKIYCSLFREEAFSPYTGNNDNWCGGTGKMLAMNHTGNLYPCLRYMESSLGDSVEPIIIGHIDTGIGSNEKEQEWIKGLQAITYTSQSPEECLNCPIADGCAWCSAYNYQVFGEINKRATFICIMHKARALGNYYYWNKYYKKYNKEERKKVYIPKEWALEIISEDEFNYLIELSK